VMAIVTSWMCSMPRYKCHKEVWALKIEGVRPNIPEPQNESDGSWLLVVEAPFAPIKVDAAWIKKHDPVAPGYYVQYEAGYTSFSPVKAFEEGYTRI